jgi:CheY-like chemotaxis protein
MVVDDTPLDRFILCRIVQNASFAEEIIEKESAMDALDFLSEASSDQLPEIIFLDINMPVMSGFDFLESYATLPENITGTCRIFLLTSSIYPGDKERADKISFVKGFINKPLTAEKLQQIS